MRMRKVMAKVAEAMALPVDIAAGVPRVELDGFESCCMDCHRGIVEYSPEKIVVALNIGRVYLEGSGLELRQMHRERLRVTGKIEQIRLEGMD